MVPYVIDLLLLAVLVIGLTAMLGVISTSLGERIFGRKKSNDFYNHNLNSQKGWRKMTRE